MHIFAAGTLEDRAFQRALEKDNQRQALVTAEILSDLLRQSNNSVACDHQEEASRLSELISEQVAKFGHYQTT